MEYRTATAEDASALVALMEELGYTHTENSITANLQSVEKRGGNVFVAVSEAQVVGCVCAIIDVRFAAGECGEIVSLVVSSYYRQQGIGKGLIKHAESWLSERTSSIRVRANAIRDDAHRFYQSLGYAEGKTQKVFRKFV